jgi:flagella basal body P-ring formation protein FlgA
MIHKFIFTLLLLIHAYPSISCEVKLPDHILILSVESYLQKSLTFNNCSKEAQDEFVHNLILVDGKITGSQLTEILKSKNFDITVSTESIQIQHLKNIIREQLSIPQDIQLKSATSLDLMTHIFLEKGDRIELGCLSCLFNRKQDLNLKIIKSDGRIHLVNVHAEFKKMVLAYRSIVSLNAFSKISSSTLKEEFTEFIPHVDLVSNLETLKFFQLNKPLRAGELLRQSDLTGINLVKAGQKTEVTIENEVIKLKTYGLSRSNGSYGEMVEVFHPQKNKKYQGIVTDFNKVSVEI